MAERRNVKVGGERVDRSAWNAGMFLKLFRSRSYVKQRQGIVNVIANSKFIKCYSKGKGGAPLYSLALNTRDEGVLKEDEDTLVKRQLAKSMRSLLN